MPTAADTAAAAAASSLEHPAAIARQNRCRSSRRPTDGRPGDRIRGRPARSAARRRTTPIATLLHEALRRPVESAQHTSLRYTDRLDELEIAPSVGSRGDALDNAMAEAWVATFKTELVDGRRFGSYEHAEHETLTWIGLDRKSTRLNSSHNVPSRMPSSA